MCGKAVCGGCLGADAPEASDSGPRCRSCAYSSLDDAMSQRAAAVETRIVEVAAEKGGAGKLRRLLGAAALVATLVAFGILAVPRLAPMLREPAPFAYGAVGDDAPDGLDECLDGLWQVRRALDAWRLSHEGSPPASLDALDAPRACPGCGQPWASRLDVMGTYRIACPRPRAHGRAAIFLDHRVGPPQVRLVAPETSR